jgi:RNA polymerase sigma-70 factor (ECF subfamily)
MVGCTTAAVKSSLQRARARLSEVDAGEVPEPTRPELRELLNGYLDAFGNSDPDALERLLRKDATLEMPPAQTWFAGRETCLPYLHTVIGTPGDRRMVATSANGQPAAPTCVMRAVVISRSR